MNSISVISLNKTSFILSVAFLLRFLVSIFLLNQNQKRSLYLVTYDVVQQKELIQTKFHRNDEAILALAKDLVEQFNSSTSNNIEHSTSYKKNPSGTSSESHLMHVKL
ncbi:unnamed protein product [Rotaria sordida]|uniref:Uncharacterized protein n=2 Tax=Rotaria sordida TaxID=392033 RepID=A0A815EAD8_9BILA|nr:unnamed protein product [Rotaria sordida]